MGLKAKIEAIIYAAEEPITLEQISLLVKDIVLAEEASRRHSRFHAESEAPDLRPRRKQTALPLRMRVSQPSRQPRTTLRAAPPFRSRTKLRRMRSGSRD